MYPRKMWGKLFVSKVENGPTAKTIQMLTADICDGDLLRTTAAFLCCLNILYQNK